MGAGERLRVVDGKGGARWAEIVGLGRSSAEIVLTTQAPSNEPAHELHLWAAYPRPERAAWLVEKATEVGVATIGFLRCHRSSRPVAPSQLARLRRVAIAAVEQCHRARVPELAGERPFEQLLELPRALGASGWFLHPEATAPPGGAPGPWVLAVGPEGGWSAEELTALGESGLTPALLGERSLRVETAAVVGAAMLLFGRGVAEGLGL
jgi:16S rRNA (uracil1498-N3)-methyltransferase